jgi:Tol biopolymer transport system component
MSMKLTRAPWILLIALVMLWFTPQQPSADSDQWGRWRRNRRPAQPVPTRTESSTAEIRTLVDGVGGRVSWSSHNGLVVFSRFRSQKDRHADIFTMRSDGTEQRCVTCGGRNLPQRGNDQPSWHPSGDYFVFQSIDPNIPVPRRITPQMEEQLTQGGAGIHNNLWLGTRDGREFFQLTKVGTGEGSLHAHFSHDGRRLLWTAREGGGKGGEWSLKVADFRMEGGQPRLSNIRSLRPRGEKGTFYESHGFSPDDRRIIFSASIGRDHPFDLDIWTYDLEQDSLARLTDSPSVWDEHAHYSPDGRLVSWITSTGYDFKPTMNYGRTLRTDLWIMDADGSDKRRVTYYNEPGHPESVAGRGIVADNEWIDNDSIVASVSLIQRGSAVTRIVRIDLKQTD